MPLRDAPRGGGHLVFYINLNDSNYQESSSREILLNDLLVQWVTSPVS